MVDFILNLFKTKQHKPLPPENSFYVYRKEGSAYDGMSGIVHHDSDGETFSIHTGKSWLVGIKP